MNNNFNSATNKSDTNLYHSQMFYHVCIRVCMCVNVCTQWGGVRRTLVIKKLIHHVPSYGFSIECHFTSEQWLPRND